MKKYFFYGALICSFIMFVGCGATYNLALNANLTSTQVQLSTNNYRIVRYVTGEATDTYVLGIGGLTKSALANNSYANMLQKANLQGSQAIINVSTSIKDNFIVVWQKRTVVTSGLVIEFTGEETITNPQSTVIVENTSHSWNSVFEELGINDFKTFTPKDQKKYYREIYNLVHKRYKQIAKDPYSMKQNIDVLVSDIETLATIEDFWDDYGTFLQPFLLKLEKW